MYQWIAHYWWLVWAVAAVVALTILRMRWRGGNESIPRRIMYALFPYSDPTKLPLRQLSARFAFVIGGCVILTVILYLAFLQSP